MQADWRNREDNVDADLAERAGEDTAKAKGQMGSRGIAEKDRCYRAWVEIRELKSGFVRTLPLRAFAMVKLLRSRETDPEPRREEVLRLEDGTSTIEVRRVDELRVKLRDKYPDGEYERTLRVQRDQEAEQRRKEAMSGLIDVLAKAVVDDHIRLTEAGGPMTVAELFRTVDLIPNGPIPWMTPCEERSPGIYVVVAEGHGIVYIGMTKRTLRRRLSEFYRHRYGEPRPHSGGERILQLTGAREVYWSATDDPARIERLMIEAYRQRHNALPHGNSR